MSRGLGKIERDILLTVYARQVGAKAKDDTAPIMRRDELPIALWGWRPVRRGHPLDQHIYRRENYPDYDAKQATLTRALHSLERKGLILTGNQLFTEGRPIYSERQAAARGIAPHRTIRESRSEEELDKVRQNPFTGTLFRLRNLRHVDKREGRNAKTVRLTEAGMSKAAELLSVK